MAFAVIHIQKLKSGSGGIGAHIDRKSSPENVIKEKSHLNRELISSPTGDLRTDVDMKIKELYKKNRKIRSDAVKSVGVILSGSHKRMKEIEKEPDKLDEWIIENLEFAKNRFGEQNLVRFTVHLDEKTPHIHCVFVPIKDGNLRFKSFFNGKRDLTKLQTEYAKKMAKFGLKRGLEQSPRKHVSTRQYYALLNKYLKQNKMMKLPPEAVTKNAEAFTNLLKSITGDLINEKIKNRDLVKKIKKTSENAKKRQYKGRKL